MVKTVTKKDKRRKLTILEKTINLALELNQRYIVLAGDIAFLSTSHRLPVRLYNAIICEAGEALCKVTQIDIDGDCIVIDTNDLKFFNERNKTTGKN